MTRFQLLPQGTENIELFSQGIKDSQNLRVTAIVLKILDSTSLLVNGYHTSHHSSSEHPQICPQCTLRISLA